MKFVSRVLFLTIFSVLGAGLTYGQLKTDSIQTGEVRGVVKDTAHNYVLDLASVAIYKQTDSALVSYQLTNAFGEFQFKKIPVGIPLRIMVSYVGYKNFKHQFTIQENSKSIDLKELVMSRNVTELKEVVVTYVPPIRMNQDTLEFNADAFSLDKNAVVEDLLRKLPRLTIWGDGSITVNGKPVKQVLVNGKPFFGGDFRVATQNIPKDAVDKIQVYNDHRNKANLLDSMTSVNIKLKKDKSDGVFGKLSSGYGTNKRYDGDAAINFFNKRSQFSVVGAVNNVNKLSDNANAILNNTTFKGTGVNIEYQPDFTLLGTNEAKAGGVVLRHDFLPNTSYNNTSSLKADYFVSNNTNKINTDLKTINTIKADSTQTLQALKQDENEMSDRKLNVNYIRRKSFFKVDATTNFRDTDSHLESSDQTSLFDASGALKSTNDLARTAVTRGKAMSVNVDLNREKNITKVNNLPGNLGVNYSLDLGDTHVNGTDMTLFRSLDNPSEDQRLHRQYERNSSNAGQHLRLTLGDFSGLLFGKRGFLGIGVSLANSSDLTIRKENNRIGDIDPAGRYIINPYLTNESKLTIASNQPSLVFNKTFLREVANRYKRVVSIDLTLGEQFYYQKNSSMHSFQNFERSYQKFVPGASVYYVNDQYGDFTDNFTLSFSTTVKYPTVNQLRPLVDSTNLYHIELGNPDLRESKEYKLSLQMDHSSSKMKNTFTYNAEITGGLVNNSLVDSVITDSIGRSSHYTVNASVSRYISFSGVVKKAFRFNQHQMQLQFSPFLSFDNNPTYINNVLNISNAISSNNSLSLLYTLSDWWAVSLKETAFFYRSKQKGANSIEFNNSTVSTIFGTMVTLTKRMNLGSNISYNSATSTGSGASRYTIWNANAAYKMLKGNNLELKLAALDLLRQNTGIINKGFNNTVIRGTSNVLRQYFMISLAYYPRQFGLRAKRESRQD